FDNSTEQTAARRKDRVGALTRPAPRRSRFRKLVLAGAPLALAAVAGLAYAVSQIGETASPPTAANKPLPRESPPSIQVAQTTAAPVPPPAVATPAAREPRLHVVSDPVGAQITLSGRKLGRAPLTTDALSPETEYEVIATLEGYQTVRRLVRTAPGVTDVTLFLLTRRVAGIQPARNSSR